MKAHRVAQAVAFWSAAMPLVGGALTGCGSAALKPDPSETVIEAEAVDGSNDVVAELVNLAKAKKAAAKKEKAQQSAETADGELKKKEGENSEVASKTEAPPTAPATELSSEATQEKAAGGTQREVASVQVRKKKGATIAYQVKPGDTLMKISFETFGDLRRWREIYQLNREKIKNPSALTPGLTLKIFLSDYVVVEKNGKPYLIRRNDTLVGISRGIYGTPKHWKRLWYNNRQLIHDPNKIYAGFYLYYEMTQADEAEARRLLGKASGLPLPAMTQAERKVASAPKPAAPPAPSVLAPAPAPTAQVPSP